MKTLYINISTAMSQNFPLKLLGELAPDALKSRILEDVKLKVRLAHRSPKHTDMLGLSLWLGLAVKILAA